MKILIKSDFISTVSINKNYFVFFFFGNLRYKNKMCFYFEIYEWQLFYFYISPAKPIRDFFQKVYHLQHFMRDSGFLFFVTNTTLYFMLQPCIRHCSLLRSISFLPINRLHLVEREMSFTTNATTPSGRISQVATQLLHLLNFVHTHV